MLSLSRWCSGRITLFQPVRARTASMSFILIRVGADCRNADDGLIPYVYSILAMSGTAMLLRLGVSWNRSHVNTESSISIFIPLSGCAPVRSVCLCQLVCRSFVIRLTYDSSHVLC